MRSYLLFPVLSKHIRIWIFTSDMATRRPFSPIFTKERSILQLWKDILAVIITRHVSTKQKNTLLFPPPITHSKPVHNLRDLTSERLLIREHGSGTRAILTKTLALKNMSVKDFRHLVEIENIHTIVTLLKEDCGISFLYKSAVEQELNEGMLVQIPLSDFMIMHDFTFLWNKNSIFSQEYDAVFKELRGAVAK